MSTVKEAAERAAALKSEIEVLAVEEKGKALTSAVDEMLALGMNVIYPLLYESEIIADGELRASVRAAYESYTASVSEIKDQLDKQTALFDAYDVNYKKYM